MSTDDPASEPPVAHVTTGTQSAAADAATYANQSVTAKVSMPASFVPLKGAPTSTVARPHNHLSTLEPIADASPATSMIELADDTPPMAPSFAPSTTQVAAQAVPIPVQPTPTSPGALGSPLASHLRSRSPHSPSSPGFGLASSSSSKRGRPTSALVASTIGSVAIKPRSNSSLTTNRPAPPSPAGSRPQSQVLELSPRGSPLHALSGPLSPPPGARGSPSPVGRDRSTSTSSAMSSSRRTRPRSTLGTSVTSASGGMSLSDPSTPSVIPSAPPSAFSRRGGSVDARAGTGGFEMLAAAVEEGKESSRVGSSSAATPDVPPSAVGSPSPTKSGTLVHLAATFVRRVIVRDFAFSSDDERHLGLGSKRPRSNWGEGEPEPEDPEPSKPLGLMGLGSWGFLRQTDEAESEGRVEDLGNEHDADAYWSDGDDEYDNEYYLDDEEPDGLYRAAYAFVPEGVNEMAVEVGDLLDVRGRGGGGDGWVVAIRLDSGAEGLVPEGYLERAREDMYPNEWAQVRDVRDKLALVGTAESSRAISLSPESTGENSREEDEDDDRAVGH